MASRQYQLDAETYLNADSNGREFQVDAETYFLEEPAAGATSVVLGQKHPLNRMQVRHMLNR